MSSTKKRTGQTGSPSKSGTSGLSTAQSRALAKAGMTASLGVLIWTGFDQSRGARRLHRLAGVSLVGFSVWHHMLYPKKSGNSS
ncbi:MAG: hypothetical protein PWQ57_95 [Desulfovibrionales bacterium]|jgi:hypothetical protein|nr:hypothetical protein [Desulfovibrionales bacterium]